MAKKPSNIGEDKPKPKKPSSKLLGTGMARKAADALTKREKERRKLLGF